MLFYHDIHSVYFFPPSLARQFCFLTYERAFLISRFVSKTEERRPIKNPFGSVLGRYPLALKWRSPHTRGTILFELILLHSPNLRASLFFPTLGQLEHSKAVERWPKLNSECIAAFFAVGREETRKFGIRRGPHSRPWSQT